MKELSKEEKAKAYDRVSKEVKDFFEGKQKMYSDVEQTLEYLFPELKESEDEKVRKAIIEYLKQRRDRSSSIPAAIGSWIAWLEKQGEQKPTKTAKWSPQEESCICQLESLVKEQWRHAEKVNNAVDIKKMQELMFFLKTLNPNKKPQRMISAEAKEAIYDKPACAWSEEDEHRIKLLEALCEDKLFESVPNSTMYEEMKITIDWLNSIRLK